MPNFKNKIGNWTVSILESTFLGFVKRIKENTIEFLEELPENSTRAVYGICLLMFVVVLAAAGAVILPASLILIVVQNFGPGVNKVLWTGIGFGGLGLFYLVVSVMLIMMVGKNVKTAMEKSTRKMVRKLEK